jgi:glutathione peroxidase
MFSFLSPKKELTAQQKSIYDFKVESLDGGEIDFAKFKGKKILIVNTASKCGLTPQYEGLEKLHDKYGKDLVIVGFPANNFMKQEPGTDKEIASFCQKNYGVSFLMASKISVKGKNQHPIYTWLTQKRYNNFKDSKVKWNFQKYLLDEKGNLISVISPTTKPMSEKVIKLL